MVASKHTDVVAIGDDAARRVSRESNQGMYGAIGSRDVASVEALFEEAGVGVHIAHQTGSVAPVPVVDNVATVETARDVDTAESLTVRSHRAYQSGTLVADEGEWLSG